MSPDPPCRDHLVVEPGDGDLFAVPPPPDFPGEAMVAVPGRLLGKARCPLRLAAKAAVVARGAGSRGQSDLAQAP